MGGDTLDVSVSGAVEGDKLYLDATSSGNTTGWLSLRAATLHSVNTGRSRLGGETREGLAEGVRIVTR